MYENIRNLREDSDLYQKDVANYLNCSQVCYSRYERGARDVPTEILIKLAKFYNTSTDYLLGLTNEKAPYGNFR
ncbi:MAG: helix-turn-helix transcriptional regulator [Oscillospiraceae bacterium]